MVCLCIFFLCFMLGCYSVPNLVNSLTLRKINISARHTIEIKVLYNIIYT